MHVGLYIDYMKRTLNILQSDCVVTDALIKHTLIDMVPTAESMRLDDLKDELANACLCRTHPRAYALIGSWLRDLEEADATTLDTFTTHVHRVIAPIQMPCTVSTRRKRLHSIALKMKRYDISAPSAIWDRLACRVVVDGCSDDCYQIVRAIVCGYRVSVFRDYIKYPKPNGYRSIHVTLDCDGTMIESQVRTREMHTHADFGASAHWKYHKHIALRWSILHASTSGDKEANDW